MKPMYAFLTTLIICCMVSYIAGREMIKTPTADPAEEVMVVLLFCLGTTAFLCCILDAITQKGLFQNPWPLFFGLVVGYGLGMITSGLWQDWNNELRGCIT